LGKENSKLSQLHPQYITVSNIAVQDNQNNLLILASLDLIQGMLLLHAQSRKLFAREIHMNVMLDLLDAGNSSAVQSATLLTLVCALIDHPTNTRVSFSEIYGLP
jgi:hypothetical protein